MREERRGEERLQPVREREQRRAWPGLTQPSNINRVAGGRERGDPIRLSVLASHQSPSYKLVQHDLIGRTIL